MFGSPAKCCLPVRIAQHYHRIGAGGNSLLGAKKAPQQRLHAERLKVVARHIAGQHPVRLAPLRTYTVQTRAFANDLGEDIPGSIPQFPILRQRQVWLPGVALLLESDLGNPAFVAYMHGAEEKAVGDAKDRGVDCDAECKGEHCDSRKAGTAEQLPHGITKIPAKILNQNKAVHPPNLLTNQGWIAELDIGPAPRLLWRHAARPVVIDLFRQMRRDLTDAFLVPLAAVQEAAEAHRHSFSPAQQSGWHCRARGQSP